nr:cation-transporting P-type ATPase [Mycoplasmopsis fermentans]
MKKTVKNKKNNEALIIKNRLVEAANMNQNEIYEKYNSSNLGITKNEIIEENKENYGVNKLSKKKRGGVLKRIWDSFFNPFSLILILLSIVSLITDIILPLTKGEKSEPWTVSIILTMVIISGILHFVEETRSSASAEKLVKMIQTTTRVERNGVAYEIPLEEVVVGDIVVLAAGDIIPADVRILSATDLFVSQSQLTGESDSIEKFPNLVPNYDYDNVTDYHNLAFMGSNVISGSAKAMVVVTGDQTYIGQVAQKINEKAPKTDFEKGIKSISWLLIKIMLVAVPLVLIITGTRASIKGEHEKWVDALLFAISVAIGLTPEMLPMIITSTLAKGAMSMSKKQTIVKSLNSIQNFGAMDIFCTDKTGTLTLDQSCARKTLGCKRLRKY